MISLKVIKDIDEYTLYEYIDENSPFVKYKDKLVYREDNYLFETSVKYSKGTIYMSKAKLNLKDNFTYSIVGCNITM